MFNLSSLCLCLSSPVIITLDSDSTLNDIKNDDSGGSSPFSSRQTVDFSHLPPLSLVHSTGVGGALDGELGELPVDILDRGWDNEPGDRSKETDPVAIDDSDNSDHGVDVEKVEDGVQLLGCDTDERGVAKNNNSGCGKAESAVNERAAERDVALAAKDLNALRDRKTEMNAGKRDSDAAISDTSLLVTILNDLENIAEPKRDRVESKPSADPDVRHLSDQPEVGWGCLNLDDWLAEQRGVADSRLCSVDLTRGDSRDARCQSFESPSPTCRTTFSSLPPPQWPKDCDAPPLKQTSGVHSSSRNAPPPLTHKDAGGGHSLPEDVRSSLFAREPIRSASRWEADSEPVAVNYSVDFKSNPAIDSHCEPDDAQAGRPRAPASVSCVSAVDVRSLAPVDSHSTAPHGFKGGESSTSHKSPPDSSSSSSSSSGSVNRRTGVDYSPSLDFRSFQCSESHSSRGIAEDNPASAYKVSPVESHPALSASPVHLHSARTCRSTDSTSRSCERKTQVAPLDLYPSSGVSAEERQASGDHFSGVDSNDASCPGLVSSVDANPQNPSSPIDSPSDAASRKRMSERVPPPVDGSNGTLAPVDFLCKGCESPTEASERLAGGKMSVKVEGHDAALSRAAAENSATTHRKSASIDSHSNHPCPADADSKCHRSTDSSSDPPVDSRCDSQPPVGAQKDFQRRRDNHVASSPPRIRDERMSPSHTDVRSDVDKHSAECKETAGMS